MKVWVEVESYPHNDLTEIQPCHLRVGRSLNLLHVYHGCMLRYVIAYDEYDPPDTDSRIKVCFKMLDAQPVEIVLLAASYPLPTEANREQRYGHDIAYKYCSVAFDLT